MEIPIPALAGLIAAIVAWITYRNHLLAAEKHKLELFEKRFAVFKAAEALLSEILRDGGIKNLGTVFNFRRDTQIAAFLFGTDVEEYLKNLDSRAIELWTASQNYEGKPVGDERSALVMVEHDKLKSLLGELKQLKSVFSPYLRFRVWR